MKNINNKENKVIFIVGASSGFGYDLAVKYQNSGYIVYAAARSLDKMQPLNDIGINILYLDVQDILTVKEAVNTIFQKEGRIDVLYNNAGYGEYGAVEDVSIDKVIRQFDINVFGVARVNNEVLPIMRKQRSGRIIITASLVSNISMAGLGWYAASKHAIKGMSIALRQELKHLGIKVILIQPGPVKTKFNIVALDSPKIEYANEDYKDIMNGFENYISKLYSNCPSTKGTVKKMYQAGTKRFIKNVYKTTIDSKIYPVLRGIIGQKMYDRMYLTILKRNRK